MTTTLFKGATYALSGIKLITKPHLRRYVLLPFLINWLLFSAAIWFGSEWIDSLINSWLPDWLNWLRFVIWPLLAILALAIIFSTFSLFANLIGAPFNSMLAEAVEKRLNGGQEVPKTGMTGLTKDILISFKSELGKFLYFGLRAIPLLILFIIPGVNLAAPFLWFLFGAWMLAHEYMDYPLANHGYPFTEQRSILRQQRSMLFGFGATILMLTLIPVINFIAMPAAVAGATLMWHEQFQNSCE